MGTGIPLPTTERLLLREPVLVKTANDAGEIAEAQRRKQPRFGDGLHPSLTVSSVALISRPAGSLDFVEFCPEFWRGEIDDHVGCPVLAQDVLAEGTCHPEGVNGRARGRTDARSLLERHRRLTLYPEAA